MSKTTEKTTEKVIKFKGFWDVSTTEKYHDYIFIFGDNDIGKGLGGQAVIRDQPNAFGIPTKKLPFMSEGSFYTDNEYKHNKAMIDAAIENIKEHLPAYKGIIYPEAGLGTGLAELDTRAPKTFEYLNEAVQNLFDYVRAN